MGKRFAWYGMILLAILMVGQAQGRERLILAHAPTLLTGLVSLAQARGLLDSGELAIDLRTFPTGDQALLLVAQGKADVATVADTAFVLEMFRQPSLHVLAAIGLCSNEVKVLARRDAGIASPADLAGKRVATQARLSTHFFLEQFLLKHDLSMAGITPLFYKLPELPDLIANGQVDAMVSRDPFLSRGQTQLGANGIVFEAPGLYRKSFLLAVGQETLQRRPKALEGLLKALIEAETFYHKHPQEAQRLLARALPEERLDDHQTHIHLHVGLDHHLLLTFEKIAEWAIRNRLTERTAPPNFMDNLAPAPLRRVRPIAVNLLE